tara:strand:+ start:378 stop:611 length:234 start_codon:yes stop_codon:yes gene_type:complete
MRLSTTNFSFDLEKQDHESWNEYYIKAQILTNCLNNNPELIEKRKMLMQYINYMVQKEVNNCIYTTDIEETLRELFG